MCGPAVGRRKTTSFARCRNRLAGRRSSRRCSWAAKQIKEIPRTNGLEFALGLFQDVPVSSDEYVGTMVQGGSDDPPVVGVS